MDFRSTIELACTPRAAWHALTDPEGIQSWFAPDVRVTPGEGGTIWVSWAPGMEGESRITAWEPERRFAYTQERGPDREPATTEFMMEERGGTVRLHLTQSGFATEMEVQWMARPWALFLHLLKHTLEQPHAISRNVTVFRFVDGAAAGVWNQLLALREFNEASAAGVVTRNDEPGYRAIVYAGAGNAITGIFCEDCGGQTGLTLMSILYDASEETASEFHRRWSAVSSSMA